MFDVGTSIGKRYVLFEHVATGGMGTVWRARDELLDRVVAVKVMRTEFVGDMASRSRMLFEARAAAAIDSAHVVRIHDVGEESLPGREDAPYIVMEFVQGVSLDELLRRGGPLSADRVTRILHDASLGLAAAHACGVVHRDIKPANILITDDGLAKITDFGIAHGSSSPDVTLTGTLVGTAKYLAPEQVEGKTATAASDVFALGVVAYECLTGEAPFAAETDLATALARVHRDAQPLPSSVPAPLSDLVMRMLAREPTDRPSVDVITREYAVPADVPTKTYTTMRPLAEPSAETVVLRRGKQPHRRLLGFGVVAGVLGAGIAVALAVAASGESGRVPVPASTPQVVVVTTVAPTETVSVTPSPLNVPAAKPEHGKKKGP